MWIKDVPQKFVFGERLSPMRRQEVIQRFMTLQVGIL